jgi:predicted NBD/HSP70 family sugar kinase
VGASLAEQRLVVAEASLVRIERRGERRPGAPDAERKSGRAPSQIGDHNLRVTLEAIRRDGPLTRLELSSRSGLTGPGITNILRRLGDDGLITARKRVEGGSGQPSTEFAINADGAYGVGVRLRGEAADAVLIDLSGKVRENRSFPIEDPAEGIADAFRSITADFGRGGRLLGVGVAMEDPSTLDLERLERMLDPMKSFVERDSVTAILVERTFGVSPAEGGLMLIIIDDRVRAGFLFRGAPFGGVRKRAGAIGLMRTGADHVPLDSIASLKVLRQTLTPEERAIFERCSTVEITPSVHGWIRNAAGHLVDAIVASAGFLAPGAILLGGDLPVNLIEALIVEIAVERGDTAVRPFISPWISAIRPATFSGAGIAIGAALLPFFDALLPSPTS